MKRKKETIRAFTLIEVAVIVVCVALMAVMVIEALSDRTVPATNAPRARCQNNLKQIGLAYREWDGDYSNKYPMSVSTNQGGSMEWGAGSNMFRHYQVMSNELNNPKILVCAADNRNQAANFTVMNNQNVSYFVGLDADETLPTRILSGDRNLLTNNVAVGPGLAVIRSNEVLNWSKAIHSPLGCVGLADGSVQQVTAATLQQLFQKSGTNVNRLAIP